MDKGLKVKLIVYFKTKLGLKDYSKGWLKGNCPHCGKENKFGVNVWLNKTNCFVCNAKVKPIELVAQLESKLVDEAYFFIRKLDLGDIAEYQYHDYDEYEYVDIKEIKYPKGFHYLSEGDDTISKMARGYAKKRGFDVEELSKRGWGYCDEPGKYFGYLIIPYYYSGIMVYFNARKFFGGGPKYNNPGVEELSIGKSMLIYNIDALNIFDKIYLCEGAINAKTIGDSGIATAGKTLSAKQIDIILKSKASKIISLLDPDALENSIKLGLTITKYGKQYKLITLPEGTDVNSLGKKETLKFIKSSEYLSYKDLYQIKIQYERSKFAY